VYPSCYLLAARVSNAYSLSLRLADLTTFPDSWPDDLPGVQIYRRCVDVSLQNDEGDLVTDILNTILNTILNISQ